MLKAKLIRYKRTVKETLGCLVINNQVFYILEPSWKNNERNISCIPAGTYRVNFLVQFGFGKYKPCFHVASVKNRSGILIYNGNIYKHTRGCLIIGIREGRLVSNLVVLNSRYALRKLVQTTNKQGFELEVIDGLVS